MIRVALLLVVGYAIVFAGPARAHYTKKPEPYKSMNLKQKHAYLKEQKAHAKYVVREGSDQPYRWHLSALPRIGKALRKVERRMKAIAKPKLYVPAGVVSGFLCIHRYEGAWNDSGDPYWGGLQMDRQFMGSYAPRWLLRRGYANVWSPWEQIWVAYQAYKSRGYGPWPNTRRMCGL